MDDIVKLFSLEAEGVKFQHNDNCKMVKSWDTMRSNGGVGWQI